MQYPYECAALKYKAVVVTGGTGGIGGAVCTALYRAGARVTVVDRSAVAIEAFCGELRAQHGSGGGELLPLAGDVTDAQHMETMAKTTLDRFGRIDALVTCAGILRAPGSLPKPMFQVTVDEWDAVMDVNLKGVFLSNRAVLPAMMAQREGNIINVSSTSGKQGRAHDAPYCASKFGVIGFSESVAEEVRGYGIKVQTLLPDAVDTPLWDQNGPIRPDFALAPERVADLIAFMLALPPDTVLAAPVIAPFRGRRRKRVAAPATATAVDQT